MAAVTQDNTQLWIHGRRLGITGDGQSGVNSNLILDSAVIAGTRGPVIQGVATSLSGAGSVTLANALAGAAIGDKVISVIDTSSFTDVTANFEAVISVAAAIQQKTSTSGHTILVTLQPQS